MCHTDKCEDATSAKMPGGLQWSVPHTLGQAHEEADKAGVACTAYDFCVSTHTYGLTQRDERLRTMVVETAIEAVSCAYSADLDTTFTLPKRTFVGDKPGVQAIKGDKSATQGGKFTGAGGVPAEGKAPGGRIQPMASPSRVPAEEGADAVVNGPGGGGGSGSEGDDPGAGSSAFRFDKAVTRPAKPSPPATEPEGECEPRHAIVHRQGAADLSKTFGNSSASAAMNKRRDNRPDALVVRVHTPKIDSIAGAELDVSDTRLFLCVPGKYRLDLELPYPVFGDEGKAKFDKAARKLEVTLSVRPGEEGAAVPFTEPKMVVDAEEEEDDGFAKVEPPAPAPAAPAPAPVPVAAGGIKAGEVVGNKCVGGGDSDEESGYVMVDKDEVRAAASAAAAVAAAAAFEASGETENQRLWREMHEKQAAERAVEAKAAEAPTPAAPAADGEGHGGDTSEEDEDNVEGRQPGGAAAVPAAAVRAASAAPSGPSVTFIRPSLGGSSLDDELD